jgi:hypothetical protein
LGFLGAWRCGKAIETCCERWSSQKRSLRRQRFLTPYGPARVRFFFSLCLSVISEEPLFEIVLRACTHSIPSAGQGVTHKAFSGLRKRRNTASITPFNAGLCCHAAPSSSSIGHPRSGDFFTVNNDRRHRFFFFNRHCLLAFTCLDLLELFLFFLFDVVVLCFLLALLSVSLTACGREMTSPPNSPLRPHLGVIIYTVTYRVYPTPRASHRSSLLCNHLELLTYVCWGTQDIVVIITIWG